MWLQEKTTQITLKTTYHLSISTKAASNSFFHCAANPKEIHPLIYFLINHWFRTHNTLIYVLLRSFSRVNLCRLFISNEMQNVKIIWYIRQFHWVGEVPS